MVEAEPVCRNTCFDLQAIVVTDAFGGVLQAIDDVVLIACSPS
jgi:hypothetical protein